MLTSDGLTPSVQRAPEGFVLSVPSDEAERAVGVLSAYEDENLERESRSKRDPPAPIDAFTGVSVSAALLLFFFLTGPRDPEVIWFASGSADAEQILAGELWRAVTALSLHADLGHALSNALFGALFLGAVCGRLGAGVGCALILLAGAGGNFANALFQGSHHVSVGASTSGFGAVGILCGLAVAQRRRHQSPGRPWWVPVGAGLALLAMLGTGGERVDLWAHLFGLLVGGALGLPVGFALPRPPRQRAQWIVGFIALSTVLYCWGLALD